MDAPPKPPSMNIIQVPVTSMYLSLVFSVIVLHANRGIKNEDSLS
jgi:hypothetical protein